MQPEIQTVVDEFYGEADELLWEVAGDDSYAEIADMDDGAFISTPAQLGYALEKYPEFKKQLLGSERGKAFMNMLNGMSKSLNKFAAVDVPKKKATPDTSRSYKPMEEPTMVAESKKKGSDMKILFEGWRKFIE